MNRRAAFTLIELLVAVGVVALLATMLMPVMALAQRSAKRSATVAVMHKVDTAIRLFRGEIGAYPYLLDYDDPRRNHLGYAIGSRITTAALKDVRDDAAAAEAKYAYDCTGTTESGTITAFAFRKANIRPLWKKVSGVWTDLRDAAAGTSYDTWNKRTNPNERLATAATLNRMAGELARLEIFAGNVDVAGLVVANGVDGTGAALSPSIGKDNSGSLLLPGSAAKSRGRPGWAEDYLQGELEARYRDTAADNLNGNWRILDAYGNPLVYVSQVHEGGRFSRVHMFTSLVQTLRLRDYGLQRRGRIGLGLLDAAGTTPLDPETNTALATTAGLPDLANRMHSDRRTYAGPGYEYDIELWSAGPDRSFAWMRDDPANRDNIANAPYDRGIR
ncbi:MAG: type II secretion system protein [Planctomycetes bacterium]|nr:type II secretion system protein [Planctomycetota bacterium]